MINYYKKEYKLMLAVDCTIFGFDHEGLKILLIRRAFQPQKGKWSLVGGFLKRKETLPDAAGRILKTYTGLEDIYLEQVHTFSDIDRDPGDRTVSTAYYALINIAEHPPHLNEKYSARWHDQSPQADFRSQQNGKVCPGPTQAKSFNRTHQL